jgi:membrane-associated phospholipid phosphatase
MRLQQWKKFLHKYHHGWVFSYFIIYLTWFVLLEKRDYVQFYPMHMRLDDYIPFCEYFIIPYLLWFFYIAGVILYFFFTNKKDFYKCCALLFSGMTICLIIYTFFPNEQNLRPETFSNTNIFTKIVQYIYSSDTSTNVCPSIHVFNSIGTFMAIAESKKLRKHKGILGGSFVLTILICLSTVFLKQHSCVDGFCGLGLAIILYTIVYRINIEKLFSTFLELKKDKTEAKIKNKKFNF